MLVRKCEVAVGRASPKALEPASKASKTLEPASSALEQDIS